MAISSKVIRELLENGVHFGHQTNKWNPKMEKYIFGEKSGIYIIDLRQTEKALSEAVEFLYNLTASGKTVLFVGTKRQAKQIIREEARRCGMFFVDERWLGGGLTNFTTVRKSVERLNHLQELKKSEVYESFAKKEKARIEREEQKLLKNLEGIRDMSELPDCLVVVDAETENIAIREAHKIGIPVIALIDTNCDPNIAEYPIPGNDDAVRAIRYIIVTLADAVEKGRGEFMVKKTAEEGRGEKAKAPEEPAAAGEEVGEKVIEEEPETAEEEVSEREREKVAYKTRKRLQKELQNSESLLKVNSEEAESLVNSAEEKEVVEGDIKLDDTD